MYTAPRHVSHTHKHYTALCTKQAVRQSEPAGTLSSDVTDRTLSRRPPGIDA